MAEISQCRASINAVRVPAALDGLVCASVDFLDCALRVGLASSGAFPENACRPELSRYLAEARRLGLLAYSPPE